MDKKYNPEVKDSALTWISGVNSILFFKQTLPLRSEITSVALPVKLDVSFSLKLPPDGFGYIDISLFGEGDWIEVVYKSEILRRQTPWPDVAAYIYS